MFHAFPAQRAKVFADIRPHSLSEWSELEPPAARPESAHGGDIVVHTTSQLFLKSKKIQLTVFSALNM